MFLRKIENFKCLNCGYFVKGNGYTNHCPKCLFSKHVDVDPGDRAQSCHGLMEPIRFEKKNGKYKIVQKCLKCKIERKCKLAKEDELGSLKKILWD